MKTTKLLWLAAALALPLAFASCEGKDDGPETADYAPGEIPGLGEAGGELTGSPFALPAGVTLAGEITGAGDYADYWNEALVARGGALTFTEKDGTTRTAAHAPATRADAVTGYFGSGYGFVDLLIPLKNTTAGPVTVTFPAALILRSVSGDCQNGVLIKKATVDVPAGTGYTVCLSFYCGNASKGSAGSGDDYVWGVVSDAAPLLDLCERVKGKKINIEEFDPADFDDLYIYRDQIDRLQDIVWNITDDEGLTEEDIAYINALPNS